MEVNEDKQSSPSVHRVSAVNKLAMNDRSIAITTSKDPILNKAIHHTLSGWLSLTEVPEEIKPY